MTEGRQAKHWNSSWELIYDPQAEAERGTCNGVSFYNPKATSSDITHPTTTLTNPFQTVQLLVTNQIHALAYGGHFVSNHKREYRERRCEVRDFFNLSFFFFGSSSIICCPNCLQFQTKHYFIKGRMLSRTRKIYA